MLQEALLVEFLLEAFDLSFELLVLAGEQLIVYCRHSLLPWGATEFWVIAVEGPSKPQTGGVADLGRSDG